MGAASYFVGELKITDGMVRGEEEWVLFANKMGCHKWWRLYGADGHSTDPRLVLAHADAVTLESLSPNQLDVTGSNCPEDLTKGETGQQIGYDIDLKDDGTADVYFSRSANELEKAITNGTIRYVTDMSCRWF